MHKLGTAAQKRGFACRVDFYFAANLFLRKIFAANFFTPSAPSGHLPLRRRQEEESVALPSMRGQGKSGNPGKYSLRHGTEASFGCRDTSLEEGGKERECGHSLKEGGKGMTVA